MILISHVARSSGWFSSLPLPPPGHIHDWTFCRLCRLFREIIRGTKDQVTTLKCWAQTASKKLLVRSHMTMIMSVSIQPYYFRESQIMMHNLYILMMACTCPGHIADSCRRSHMTHQDRCRYCLCNNLVLWFFLVLRIWQYKAFSSCMTDHCQGNCRGSSRCDDNPICYMVHGCVLQYHEMSMQQILAK